MTARSMGVPIVIPELPPAAQQLADYRAALQRHGPYPASVASAHLRKSDLQPTARRRRRDCGIAKVKTQEGVLTCKQQVKAVLAKNARCVAVWLDDIAKAIPSRPISSIKGELTKLVQVGEVERVGVARYRLPRK